MGMNVDVQGADALIAWFGEWPSFHDAEILELRLRRAGSSHCHIHTWKMTHEIDTNGYYVLEKHVVVTFTIDNIEELSLEGFNRQNVLSGLEVSQTEDLVSLTLEPCYGLGGYLTAKSVIVSFVPGKPVEEMSL